jgi:periplasmic divalent cation tolerance protein
LSAAPKIAVLLVTAPAGRRAAALARAIVSERLAACVNVVPHVVSFYQWKGRMCNERESLLLIKTTAHLVRRLTRRLRILHPYENPEIIALRLNGGSADYLKWVAAEVR